MAVRVEHNAEPIPGYRLIERLGGGGFGEVWKAEAPGGLHKAIKFVYGDLGSAGDSDQRAKQELKALERVRTVRHPYILSLERYEVIEGQLVIVMELADRNLWDRFRECRAQGLPGIPREELLRYMEETAEALDLMNKEFQLQHLDIKPQNLFLVHNHIKVADFGLVKDLEGSQASVTGGITPVYAAPETFDGRVSRFSDQYSLAIVFQELLTGQRPFNGTNVRQLIMQHISAAPNVAPLNPVDQPTILRALSKKPDERYPTCTEFVTTLRQGTPGSASGSLTSANAPVSPSAITSISSVPQTWQGILTPAPSSVPQTANIRPGVETGSSSQGATHCIRAVDQAVLGEGAFRAPPEISGSGSLFPALVIAIGQVGLTVMQRLREILHQQVAPLTQLTHLRFLLVDTDPEVMRVATRGAGGAGLSASEVLLTQLNRPSYYLKPRDGRPALEQWLNPRMLYRIPRSQVTTGVRALGRLAFIDNYRTIARRLQLELETILDPQALQSVARLTRLGLRSNRPRIYLLTSLAGGSGSGMFIDMAYTLRALLKQMGYENPDIVGILLLPPVDGSRTRLMSLGNTYAALTELNYFGSPDKLFQARYHERESPVYEQGPPFTRNVFLPLPEESDEVASQELIELCGQFLYRDLATPLGRAADLGRAGLPTVPWEARGQFGQTFNLFQLSWPQQSLLQAVARRLCQRLVQRWNSKDSKPLREQAQAWVHEQWLALELGADCFIQRLQDEVSSSLGKSPEATFLALVEPLKAGSAQGEPGSRQRARTDSRGLDPAPLMHALQEMEQFVGSPQEDYPAEEPPQLIRILREVSDRLAAEWSQKLAEISVQLIEEPTFRLAGAEEAIRQLIVSIEQVLQHHEPLARELAQKASEAHDHLSALAGRPLKQGQTRPRLTAFETIELARAYPKWRYQSLVLQYLSAAFVGLRGHLSDELREVNFCRVRLTELLRLLEEPTPAEAPLASSSRSPRDGGIGRKLFLSGCKDLHEAVELYLNGITPEHLLELDVRIEDMLRRNFTALVHVCLTSANILKDVYASMLTVARDYAAEHLPPTSVTDLFFEQFTDPQEAESEISNCFDEACPEILPSRSGHALSRTSELCLIATPDDLSSEQFKQLVQSALPETEIQFASSPDDILFFRERNNIAISDLEHMGPLAHDAYMQMSSTENFTPHTRTDIKFRGR